MAILPGLAAGERPGPDDLSPPDPPLSKPSAAGPSSAVPAPGLGQLKHPTSVDHRHVRWDYVLPITAMHVLALLAAIPWLFSWTGLIALIVGVSAFGQLGVPIGYHRLLTHRSFRVPKWLERSFVTIALCCAQDTPARWVSWHRMHHQNSDDQDDPHSPFVNFLWSHVGWLFFNNSATHTISAYYKYARDVLDDPFYFYLEKHRAAAGVIYLVHALAFFLVGLAAGSASAGNWTAGVQFGLSLLVWGVVVVARCTSGTSPGP